MSCQILSSQINQLPDVLINLVYEYYPGYKFQFNHVLHELLYTNVLEELIDNLQELNTCSECDQYLGNSDPHSVIKIGKYDCKFCSSYCEWSWKYDYRKMNG